jgi:hypothetical protein
MRLSARVEKDWFIADLMAKGVEVEYWDVTSLFFSNLQENFIYETDYLKKINTYEGLDAHLKNQTIEEIDFVIIVTQEARFYKFFLYLQRYNCKLHFIHWGVMPVSSNLKYHRLITALAQPFSLGKTIYNRLKSAIYMKSGLIKPFDVVFAAGEVALNMHPDVPKVVPINLIDYEKYVSVKGKEARIVDGDYAVFLDINLAYQSDLTILGLASLNAEKYFESLNIYFKKIEIQHNVKVVIASHPKSKYTSDTFNGRLIYENLTPELVKDSKFVISHHSTALSYAILNEKPIVFILTDEMLLLYKKTIIRSIKNLAGFLGIGSINIDRITTSDELAIRNSNLSLYNEYKYNYLTTHESECYKTGEIFTQFFI